MRSKIKYALLAAFALLLALPSFNPAGHTAAAAPPEFDPDNFVRNVTNPYFPLTPGTTFYYEGVKEGIPISETVYVTSDTKRILGVRTTVVHALAYEDGILVEDTLDWFAQDRQGNVWYLGEDTKELDEQGNVISTEGSWQAGVDGAKPGIIMLAAPQVGDRYYQEYYPDVAEDRAKVLSLDAEVTIAYGSFEDVLKTKEWTQLEPGVVEHKYYAKGVGFILSIMVKGGEERLELVRLTKGAPNSDD